MPLPTSPVRPLVIDSGEASRQHSRPSGTAHSLIVETARAMAHELYDTMMLDNEWFAAWKAANPAGASAKALERNFVRRNLTRLLPGARAVLAASLATLADAASRETVYNALLLDAELVRVYGPGRQAN